MFSFGSPDSKFAQGMETFANTVWGDYGRKICKSPPLYCW